MTKQNLKTQFQVTATVLAYSVHNKMVTPPDFPRTFLAYSSYSGDLFG